MKAEVIDYVLKKPAADQRTEIDKAIEQALGALELVVAGDMEKAMMKVHARPPRPKPPKPPAPPKATTEPTATADDLASKGSP